MTTYHARRLTDAKHGDGWYVIRRENGIEKVLDCYFSGDFPESEMEAAKLAHHLNQRSRTNGEARITDRPRRRVNG